MTSQSTGPGDRSGDASGSEGPTDAQIRELIDQALPGDSGLTPLRGFKLDLSANRGFRKFFYSANCGCGTAALLSLEVAHEKTPSDVSRSLSVLMDRLQGQARMFYSMSCEDHEKMRGAASLGATPKSRPADAI